MGNPILGDNNVRNDSANPVINSLVSFVSAFSGNGEQQLNEMLSSGFYTRNQVNQAWNVTQQLLKTCASLGINL